MISSCSGAEPGGPGRLRSALPIVCCVLALALVAAANGWPVGADVSADNPSEITPVEDERGILALDQILRELSTPFTVMCVAARPSDVDEGTLALYRKKAGARVVVLFVTRGEGAPSLRRPELDQELGVIRTREVLESARLIGADVFFLNLRDFGHSSSADEAIRVWGHGEALKRMVRAFRSLRPDVVITNHRANFGDGIQRAVARITREAFDRAASATPPPEAGVEPWQARRLFERVDWTEGVVSQQVVKVELTELDRLRGATYAQLGLSARKCLVSWNGDRAAIGPDRERAYYRIAHSAPAAAQEEGLLTSLLDGLKLPETVTRSLEPPRIAGRSVDVMAPGDQLVETLTEKLVEKRAEGTAEQLHSRYGVEFFRVLQFTHALERALATAIGLEIDVVLSDSTVVARQKISANVRLRNHSTRAFSVIFRTPVSLSSEDRGPYKESEVSQALPGASISREIEYEVPADAARTLPVADHLREQEYYGLGTTLPGSQPAEPFGNGFICFADIGLGQTSITLAALARYNVARSFEIATIPFAMVRELSTTQDLEFPVRLRNNTPGPVTGALWIVQLAAADDNYEPIRLSFSREDEEVEVTLKLKLPLVKPPLSPDVLLEFRRGKPPGTTAEGRSASTEGPAEVLGSARIPVVSIDAQVATDARVGFIRGRDAWLADALTQLGVRHEELGARTLNRTVHGNAAEPSQTEESCRDLSGFTAIIVDELAYLSHRQLIADNRCLMQYVRQGGKLVVLTQQADDLALLLSRSQFAPFPITLATTSVGVNASVKLLDPPHAAITSPNRLTAKDFEGWVGELAQNVPRQWSKEYTPLLESAEQGLENQKGLMLVVRSGEGLIVYSALSLRRQFRAINPGAIRVLANLVSLMDGSAKPSTRN